MALLYTTIFYKENKQLCEITEFYGNLNQVCRGLAKTLKKEFKGTFSYEEKYYFHYLDEKNITYICLTSNTYPIELAHYYLTQLKELLEENFSESQLKISDMLGVENILKGKIIQKQDFFNQDNSSLQDIKNKLNENNKYNSVISLDTSREKVDRINKKNKVYTNSNDNNDSCYQQTDFNNSSVIYEPFINENNTPSVVLLANSLNETKQYRYQLRVKRAKNIIIVFLIMLTLGMILSFYFCGFDFSKCRAQ